MSQWEINLSSNRREPTSDGPARSDMGMFVLVGTPIGNLGDISQRMIEAFNRADVIAAEDTRRLRTLLSYLKIGKKEIWSIDANKEDNLASKVVEMVRSGKTVLYTTDAGMPGVSDPGSKLVRAVAREGLRVDGIPGPSAPVLAAALSGLCESGFSFGGFLPVKTGAKSKVLSDLAETALAVVVFESPIRIGSLLECALGIYGDEHRLFVGRELTKLHQETFYGSIKEAFDHFSSKGQRGEFVIVFDAKVPMKYSEDGEIMLEAIVKALSDHQGKIKVLAAEIAELTGVSKNRVYEIILSSRKGQGEPNNS